MDLVPFPHSSPRRHGRLRYIDDGCCQFLKRKRGIRSCTTGYGHRLRRNQVQNPVDLQTSNLDQSQVVVVGVVRRLRRRMGLGSTTHDIPPSMTGRIRGVVRSLGPGERSLAGFASAGWTHRKGPRRPWFTGLSLAPKSRC